MALLKVAWAVLRGNPLEALTALALAALLGLTGWLWVDASQWEARATIAESRVDLLAAAAKTQDDRFREQEKRDAQSRRETLEASGRALADVAGQLERLRKQAAADRARRPVPTVPAVDADLDTCRARVAAASRDADAVAARVEGVADRVAAVLESAGGADRNRTALIAFRADAARCEALH